MFFRYCIKSEPHLLQQRMQCKACFMSLHYHNYCSQNLTSSMLQGAFLSALSQKSTLHTFFNILFMWREYFYFVLYYENVLKMKSSALFLATGKTYLLLHMWIYSIHFVNSRNRHLTELEFLKSLYRPARLHRLAEFIPRNQFRGSINI
jgi:hypothetical protein